MLLSLLRLLLPFSFEALPLHSLHSHQPILETRLLAWPDEAACAACAARLAAAMAADAGLRDVYIELLGPLGAGKTTFVRHLLRALGVEGRVKSPTYAVVEPHTSPSLAGLAISHFDFYRFDDPREWADAGLRDLFAAPGLKLAEWPEKAAPALPPADLRLAIEPLDSIGDGSDGAGRSVTADALTAAGAALLSWA